MSFSPALKSFIVVLLPLTLVWKLTIKAEDSVQIKNSISYFLVAQNYQVSEANQTLNGMPVIRATSKTCRMLIMRASPDGWTRDLINDNATATDRIFVVFRGKIYKDQTNWTIMAGYLRSEILYRLGLVQRVGSVIAVVAAAACNAEHLPWAQLRDF